MILICWIIKSELKCHHVTVLITKSNIFGKKVVQMTFGGPGCRLQTCRRWEAQWFDSTFWAGNFLHILGPALSWSRISSNFYHAKLCHYGDICKNNAVVSTNMSVKVKQMYVHGLSLSGSSSLGFTDQT